MRRAAKVDSNQTEIVNTLRQLGCSVTVTSTIGKGFPDLVVGISGRTFLVEVKSKKGTYTSDQLAFVSSWKGNYYTVRTREDCVALINTIISMKG
jgi:hypothetical protein